MPPPDSARAAVVKFHEGFFPDGSPSRPILRAGRLRWPLGLGRG